MVYVPVGVVSSVETPRTVVNDGELLQLGVPAHRPANEKPIPGGKPLTERVTLLVIALARLMVIVLAAVPPSTIVVGPEFPMLKSKNGMTVRDPFIHSLSKS